MVKTIYTINGYVAFIGTSGLNIALISNLTFNSKEQIKPFLEKHSKQAKERFDFETKGFVYEIKTERKIEDEDENYFDIEYELDSVGELSESERNELEEKLIARKNN